MKALVVMLAVSLSAPSFAQMLSPSGPSATSSATPAAAEKPEAVLVNVNSASIEELCTLPGIGRKKAEAIVALRTRRPLTRVTQLLQVKGIGPRTLQRLKPMLSVAPVPKEPTASMETPPAVSGTPIMAAVHH